MNILKLNCEARIRYIFMDKIADVDVSKTKPEVRINYAGGDHASWDLILVNNEARVFMKHFRLMVSEQGELY